MEPEGSGFSGHRISSDINKGRAASRSPSAAGAGSGAAHGAGSVLHGLGSFWHGTESERGGSRRDVFHSWRGFVHGSPVFLRLGGRNGGLCLRLWKDGPPFSTGGRAAPRSSDVKSCIISRIPGPLSPVFSWPPAVSRPWPCPASGGSPAWRRRCPR